jgi:hypothetical protein
MTTQIPIVLKPCPFCGKEIGEKNIYRNDIRTYKIVCWNCHGCSGGAVKLTIAIRKWNKRDEPKRFDTVQPS